MSEAQSNTAKTPQDQSVTRTAVVLNGGVSLAVWMGGVTHELDRLRRSSGTDGPSKAWSRIVACSRPVVVDCLAGTSAGGLNGSLLASAIAQGAELPDLKDLWVSKGQLNRENLLHKARGQATSSVLDGNFFHTTIRECLEAMDTPQDAAGQDVTLLVTSSALSGSSIAVKDIRGSEFRGGDHRRIYRFQRSAGELLVDAAGNFTQKPTTDFSTHRELVARAARASAGFPFAFESLRETSELKEFDKAGSEGRASWLMDGGVLDNAPFTPLLAELRDMPRSDKGNRWIVYVVPGISETSTVIPTGPNAPIPDWTQLPAKVLSLRGESDLRDDIMSLKDAAREAENGKQGPESVLRPSGSHTIDEPRTTALNLLPMYRRSRASAVLTEIKERRRDIVLAASTDLEEQIARLLSAELLWMPSTLTPTRAFTDHGDQWQWGLGAARRIARWISRDARGASTANTPEDASTLDVHLRDAITITEQKLAALEKRFRGAIDDGVAAENVNGVLDAINEALLADGVNTLIWDVLSPVVADWAIAREMEIEEAWDRALTAEVLSSTVSWTTQDPAPPFSLLLVSPETPFAADVLGLIDESNKQLNPGWPNNKLYGTRLAHFGAFGAQHFREWDWMWGRLDGALTFASALLQEAHVDDDEQLKLLRELADEVLHECNMKREDLQTSVAQVLALTPGNLIAQSRVAHTNFDAAIADAIQLCSTVPIIAEPDGEGFFGRLKARMWSRFLRLLLTLTGWWARRYVRKQKLPRAASTSTAPSETSAYSQDSSISPNP